MERNNAKVNWLTAFNALLNVYTNNAFSNLAINDAINERPNCSSGMVRVMTKGVLRNSLLLDYNISYFTKNGLHGIKKRTLIILRMGFYAIAFMDSIPEHAAVNEAVALAKKVSRGTSGFVNAVLRSFIRNGKTLHIEENTNYLERISLKYSFPIDLVKLFFDQYGKDESEKIMKGLYEVPKLFIRVNTLRISRENLIEKLREEGFEVEKSGLSKNGIEVENGALLSSKAYKAGLFSVQSSSSLCAIEAFDPQAGERVLDLCAAPGGKSSAIAERMNNIGEIISCDLYPHRVELIKNQCKRLGIKIVKPKVMDSTIYEKSFCESFDRVLADVPCSGLGVIASKPELKNRVCVKEFSELVHLQLTILENAYKYLKRGGIMLYSTCTLNKDENEEVIKKFIQKHQTAEVIETNTILPYNNKVGFFYCKINKK